VIDAVAMSKEAQPLDEPIGEIQRLFIPLDENRTLAIIVRGKIVEITLVHSRPNTMATLQETVTFNVP
jgi:hypothetical protein